MSDRKLIPSHQFSAAFLKSIEAPALCKRLTFKIEAAGVLTCTAVYYDERRRLQTKMWEVRLHPDSTFYKLISGEA